MDTFPAIAALKMLQLQGGLWFGIDGPYQWGSSIGVARVESRSCRVIVHLREDAGDGDGTVRCGVRLERVKGIDYHDMMGKPAAACSREVACASSGCAMIFKAVGAKDGAIKAVSRFIRMICMSKRLSLYLHRALHESFHKTLQRTCIRAASIQHWSMFLSVPDD